MKSLKGHLLVASADLADPNFHHTVLLMLEHSGEGAAAVVLNRPTETTIAEISASVFDRPDDWPKPIYLGGPVEGPLIVLHKVEELGDREAIDGVFTTVDPEKIHELIRRRVEPSIFLANYSGWGPGQLEGELAEDSWLYTPADAKRVFDAADPGTWRDVVKEISDAQLADMLGLDDLPDDPSVN